MNIQDLFDEPLWNISDQTPKKNTGKEGKWINVGHKMGAFRHPYSENYKCPYCDYEVYWFTPDFCPECGAHLLDEYYEEILERLNLSEKKHESNSTSDHSGEVEQE